LRKAKDKAIIMLGNSFPPLPIPVIVSQLKWCFTYNHAGQFLNKTSLNPWCHSPHSRKDLHYIPHAFLTSFKTPCSIWIKIAWLVRPFCNWKCIFNWFSGDFCEGYWVCFKHIHTI